MNTNNNSVLIGNGLDIQVGGDDYLNKWIIVRLLAKAKMGKYDALFMSSKRNNPLISGDDIVELFNNMVTIANRARVGEYNKLAEDYSDEDLIDALNDFIKKHCNNTINSIEEIGMEDWLLILLLFLLEEKDLSNQYSLAKQGFERMILDAIYCEGNIQNLHLKMNKESKDFFNNFDNIFSLNYDNTIEKLTRRSIFHLHGDFNSKSQSEDPLNVNGYIRQLAGKIVCFPPQFAHCNCSAILDFSGNRKYNYATNMTNAFLEFEKVKELARKNESEYKKILKALSNNQAEFVRIGVNKNLFLGHNYHFNDFENITGTLTIIGLAQQNDNHIFSCINKSTVSKVIFYDYFGSKPDAQIESEIKTITLPINKAYEIRDVKEIWESIKINPPVRCKYSLNEKQLQLLAPWTKTPILMQNILWQLNSIPTYTKRIIFDMMTFEIQKRKYHTIQQNENEVIKNFCDFGKVLQVSSLSPQALYAIYYDELSKKSKVLKKNKKIKRKK